jgi:hypothetical protein
MASELCQEEGCLVGCRDGIASACYVRHVVEGGAGGVGGGRRHPPMHGAVSERGLAEFVSTKHWRRGVED